MLSTSGPIFVYHHGADNTIYAVGVSGTNEDYNQIELTSGESAIDSSDFHVVGVTATKAVFVCQVADSNPTWSKLIGKVLSITGSSPSVTDTADLLAPNNTYFDNVSLGAWESDRAILSYEDSVYGICSGKAILDVSTAISLEENCVDLLTEWSYFAVGYTASKFLAMSYDSGLTDGVVTTGITVDDLDSCISGYSSYALGLSTGKDAGNVAWVTQANNTILQLIEIALPGLTITDRYSLGSATIAEAISKARVAFPFVPFGYDDTVYVFGNMDDPQSLGGPSHVIRTINGGSSFTLIENGWSIDHCGAVIVTTGNYMYAIRNRGTQSKLYRDNADNVLVVKLTLPFAAEVVHHGILVDYRSSDVYVCANSADPIMVAKIPPPHLIARDITYDHEATEGIWSILGL
jgi:hypothetical protein